VPAIIVSPWAKRSHVDTTQYETVSLLKFIEWRWPLAPLASRDANAANLLTPSASRSHVRTTIRDRSTL
jgi:hypothetical protein